MQSMHSGRFRHDAKGSDAMLVGTFTTTFVHHKAASYFKSADASPLFISAPGVDYQDLSSQAAPTSNILPGLWKGFTGCLGNASSAVCSRIRIDRQPNNQKCLRSLTWEMNGFQYITL